MSYIDASCLDETLLGLEGLGGDGVELDLLLLLLILLFDAGDVGDARGLGWQFNSIKKGPEKRPFFQKKPKKGVFPKKALKNP